MTSATKRKHVVNEMLNDFSIPEGHQRVAKVLGTPGSNLHEVITHNNKKILCSLPVKFRKNIWIKRGDFVVIESIQEGDKVQAEIVRILYPQHVKYLQKLGHWHEFTPHPDGDKDTRNPIKMMDQVDLDAKNPLPRRKEDYILKMDIACKGDMLSDGEYSSEDDLCDIPANTNRPTVFYEEDSSDSGSDCSGEPSGYP